MENEILEEPIDAKDYIVHSTIASVLLGLPVSEASVEKQAFSRQKLVHNCLRAKLGTEKLDDILFIRYNFEKISKIRSPDQEVKEINEEIENWQDLYDTIG